MIVNRSKSHNKDDLQTIPGVGESIEKDLRNIGIYSVADLKGKDPEKLFELCNRHEGKIQDRCLLYVLREAVYFAQNPNPDPEKLKWWNLKD
jgi:predicted RecB family nuclease